MPYGNLAVDTVTTSTGQIIGASSSATMKNRLINGAMVIDQRNAGASVTIPANAYTYSIDRWFGVCNQASKYALRQNVDSVTPPAGFNNYLGATSSSAYSVISTDYFTLGQMIEGFNFADLAWGTAAAQTVTLSFWARSSLTGIFGGAVQSSSQGRSFPFSYTINSANTWEYKSITITGDVSGTWVGATNGIGARIFWSVGAGTAQQCSAAQVGTWIGAAPYSVPNAVNVVSTSGATFYITGVQLEAGAAATSFDYRSYGTELALCQRYFQKVSGSINGSAYQFFAVLTYENASNCFGAIALRATMRTQPTTTYSGSFTLSYGTLGTLINDTNQTGGDVALVGFNSGSGGAAGSSTYFRAYNSSATFISFSAEL